MTNPYEKAQAGMSMLKAAIYDLLMQAPENGLRSVEIGKGLGIYAGHVGHEGHIPRTLLEIMRSEGVVMQGEGKRWVLSGLEDVAKEAASENNGGDSVM